MTLPEYQELSSDECSLMETAKENEEKHWVKHVEVT